MAVVEATRDLLSERLASNLAEFLAEYCREVDTAKDGSTPAKIIMKMRQVDDEFRTERDLESLLRRHWHFVAPQNLHRVKPSRQSKKFIALN